MREHLAKGDSIEFCVEMAVAALNFCLGMQLTPDRFPWPAHIHVKESLKGQLPRVEDAGLHLRQSLTNVGNEFDRVFVEVVTTESRQVGLARARMKMVRKVGPLLRQLREQEVMWTLTMLQRKRQRKKSASRTLPWNR